MSDFTYIHALERYSHLSLITDCYSRRIRGNCLYPSMEAAGCIEAIKMAKGQRSLVKKGNLIHNSDHGVQYCSATYVAILNEHKIAISMAKSPYENDIAERIKGTVKNEFKEIRIYKCYGAAKMDIAKVVRIYIQKRPHGSLDYLTPDQAHQKEGPLKHRWKTYARMPTKKKGSNRIFSI